jgi:hypothetical protein
MKSPPEEDLDEEAAARLSHPGSATVYSLEEFGDSVCIVSEYVRGRTLHQSGPLSAKILRALESSS